MTDSGEEKTVRFLGKNLYPETNPGQRAEAVARETTIPERCLLLVPSPLLGYGLDALLARLPESSRILCLEREETLMRLSLDSLPGRLAKEGRLAIVRTDSPGAVAEYVEKTFGAYRFRKSQVVVLNRGYSLHGEFYRNSAQAVLEVIQTYWRNKMTSLALGRLWMKNLFLNLAALPSAKTVSDLRITRPLVLAGAGESLEASLEALAKHRRHLAILAVDTALPVLLGAGLEPDCVIAAEAQFANQQDFLGLKNWNIPVLADLTSYPAVVRRFRGERYFFLSRFSDLAWLGREEVAACLPPIIPPLGSVGVMALYLAGLVTPKEVPLFLTGFDFSYTPGKPHSRGAPSHLLGLTRDARLSFPRTFAAWCDRPKTPALRKDGRTLPSDAVLASYQGSMKALALERGNVWDLAGTGLDLGLPVLGSEADFESVLASAAGTANVPAGNDGAFQPGTAEIRENIMKLYRFTLSALAEGRDLVAKGAPEATDFLEAYDFITLDFPDVPPLPAPAAWQQGFARRSLASIEGYAEKIRQGMERIATLRQS